MKNKKQYIIISIILGIFITSQAQKKYVTPQELARDSYALAKMVFEDNFIPTALITLWRGGAPIGIRISEYFRRKKIYIPKDIPLTVSAYNHDQLKKNVFVGNLTSVTEALKGSERLLLVDDIIDTGSSLVTLLDEIKNQCGQNTPKDIRIATVYYKPKGLKKIPHHVYSLHEAKQWIVFPHELEGLSDDEIKQSKGNKIAEIIS